MGVERITNLGVKGFRSLRDVTWKPGSLNVIIGPNGTGKSNLLKCLQMIGAAADGNLRDYVDAEGGMGAITWHGNNNRISVELDVDGQEQGDLYFTYGMSLHRMGTSADYRVDIENYQASDSDAHLLLDWYERNANEIKNIQMSHTTTMGFKMSQKSDEILLSLAKSPLIPDERLRKAQYYLATLLVLDDIHTNKGSRIRQAVTSRREERLSSDGQNLTEVLHSLYESNYDFKERIDEAMVAAFGDMYKGLAFPPGAEQQVQLGIRWAGMRRPEVAANLSDGTLRFLFIIAALSLPDMPPVVAIDEPENGLHPSMMRIIAEYAEDAALRSQIIFTTHSAAFLDGFRKDNPPTTTVAALQDGATTLKVVDPDLLLRWLSDYTLGSLYRSHELEQMQPVTVSTVAAE